MKELDKDEIAKISKEYAERMPLLKTHEDLIFLSDTLRKHLIERALNAELDYHLDTEEQRNSRNGYSKKTIHTEDGSIELTTPRDRKATF
jgi:putative transposase